MKTYLITGGCGFIGSNFIKYLFSKQENVFVINVDNLTYAGNYSNLQEFDNNKNYVFVRADIADKSAIEVIFEKYNIDFLVNFAAESHVDRSIVDPETFIKTNVLGTTNLLNIAKKNWMINNSDQYLEGKKYIQISTDEVYGSLGKEGLFTENTPLDPHSPYSASKASADLIVKSFYDTFKMPINITRCSNNYGPYQFPEKLIPLVISNCLNHENIPIYGDGMNIRDWLFVEDHCSAIDLVIDNGKLGEVYNIGGNNETTNIEMVKSIINYINKNVDENVDENLIRYVSDRKGHDRRYGIDASKIKADLGWSPLTQYSKGIIQTINWYLDNTDWLDEIKNGKYRKLAEKEVCS
ncbi:dTDP-glucose 4,6-dehydratase [Cytobacillus sp. FSL K6-0129]|uniref:dTDP-glucose 4,6-dehydratase n=1 Tax=Cytobacillus sp. FSL K6-0129 TaxID=2921421 RepID=UPI0030FA2E19